MKRSRFKSRFHRSPTMSEAELDDEELDELEEDTRGEGGVNKSGAEGGEEGAGEEGGESAAFEAVVKIGKISMGTPAKWYGALVGEGHDGGFQLGFDDGDLQYFGRPELQSELAAGTMMAAVPEERGIVANKSGYAMADSFVTFKHGSKLKTIGVLVGLTDISVAGMPVYEACKIDPNAFEPPKRMAACGANRSRVHRTALRPALLRVW